MPQLCIQLTQLTLLKWLHFIAWSCFYQIFILHDYCVVWNLIFSTIQWHVSAQWHIVPCTQITDLCRRHIKLSFIGRKCIYWYSNETETDSEWSKGRHIWLVQEKVWHRAGQQPLPILTHLNDTGRDEMYKSSGCQICLLWKEYTIHFLTSKRWDHLPPLPSFLCCVCVCLFVWHHSVAYVPAIVEVD